MKFLFNNVVVEVGAESNPFLDKGFPLSRAQYETVQANDLVEMLAGEFRQNADALRAKPVRVKRLLWMLHDKAKVNALRLTWDGGTNAEFGNLPELAFAGLLSLAAQGGLTMDAIDQAVWTKLQR